MVRISRCGRFALVCLSGLCCCLVLLLCMWFWIAEFAGFNFVGVAVQVLVALWTVF